MHLLISMIVSILRPFKGGQIVGFLPCIVLAILMQVISETKELTHVLHVALVWTCRKDL